MERRSDYKRELDDFHKGLDEACKPMTRYVIHSEVVTVEEHKVPVYISGFGADAVFGEKSIGWFVHLLDSHEAFGLGPDKPTLAKGDKVKITMEKVT